MERSFIRPPIATEMVRDIMNLAPLVFGIDLVFFLASEFRLGWHPQGVPNYHISELSPFDSAMQQAAKNLVRKRNVDYNAKYEDLVNPNEDDKLVQFVNYARLTLSAITDEDWDVAHIFLHIVHIAGLSLVFYERGTRDALVFASILISQAMTVLSIKTNGEIYGKLSNFAAKVSEEKG